MRQFATPAPLRRPPFGPSDEEGMIHWWRHHCHPASWTWCDEATAFGITTAEVYKAVLGIDLSDQPLPLGGAFHMLPNALPSHYKGLDKRLFKPPYSKTLTPANRPSEAGLAVECSPRATCKGAAGGAHLVGLGAILWQRIGREQRCTLFSHSPLPESQGLCQFATGLAQQGDRLSWLQRS